MSKRVPANLADPGAHGCRFDVPSQNALLPTWLPLAIRKYPVKSFSVQATLPVSPEGIGEIRINRKWKPRGFRLRIADSPLDNASPHQQRAVLPIKIAPLQAHDLARPLKVLQTRALLRQRPLFQLRPRPISEKFAERRDDRRH
jgi:hypothetical protein